jgi:hypothetical protein
MCVMAAHTLSHGEPPTEPGALAIYLGVVPETDRAFSEGMNDRSDRPNEAANLPLGRDERSTPFTESANFGVSDRRFRFKPAGGFGGNRQAVSVQSGTPLRMGFGPDFGEPPLRDTSYLALACQSKYSCHYLQLLVIVVVGCGLC